MFQPIPAVGLCFTLCVLLLLETTQGSYPVCCKGSKPINNRCVCDEGVHPDKYHNCVEPCWKKCRANADCNRNTFKCYCKPGFVGNPYVGCLRIAKFQFARSSYVVRENTGIVKLQVDRISGGLHRVVVKWAATKITAQPGTDYIGNFGTVTFEKGEKWKFIEIRIVNDQIAEPTEKFKVTLTSASPAAAIGSRSVTTVTITDSDIPCRGECKRYPYSICDPHTNKCVCKKGYYGDAYHGGCKCRGGGGY